MEIINTSSSRNIFLRMHPLQRILLSILISAIVYFLIRDKSSTLIFWMLLWDVFSLSYLIFTWIVLVKRPVPEIRQMARKDDGSAIFVFY